MDAGVIGTAAEPFLPFRPIPQRAHEFPRVTGISGAEQPTRNRAAPQRAEAAALERPDAQYVLRDHPATHRLAPFFFPCWRCRHRRRAALLPLTATVRGAMQLRSEMTVIERGICTAVCVRRQHHRYVVAEE